MGCRRTYTERDVRLAEASDKSSHCLKPLGPGCASKHFKGFHDAFPLLIAAHDSNPHCCTLTVSLVSTWNYTSKSNSFKSFNVFSSTSVSGFSIISLAASALCPQYSPRVSEIC